MISKIKLVDKYLNLLLVFLLPTQLALHFWPNFSYVFGIRVDYLSPAIYITDLLFFLVFVYWSFNNKKLIVKDVKDNKKILSLFAILVAINLIVSVSFWSSLVSVFKILEVILFAYYFSKRKNIFSVNVVTKVLFYSMSLISVVGLLQFIRGKTFGLLFYILGERSFSIFTPGIALVNIFGNNHLRNYSTFPHPNALAGFIVMFLIMFIFSNVKLTRGIKYFGLLLILANLLLTFSLSSLVGIVVCIIIFLLFKKTKVNGLVFSYMFIGGVVVSLLFSVLSSPIKNMIPNFSDSYKERLNMGNVAGRIFAENPIVGKGLNTYIQTSTKYSELNEGAWLLQPVHNIFLLALTNGGLLLLVVIFYFFSKFLFNKRKRNYKVWILLAYAFLITTGLFDHYWLTSHQNIMLVSMMLGISLKEIG